MPRWMLPILVLAGLHVIAGLTGVIAALLVPELRIESIHSPWIHLAQMVTYGTAASWLISGSAQDRRAGYLGGFLLLISPFGDRDVTISLSMPVVSHIVMGVILVATVWSGFIYIRAFLRSEEAGEVR